MTCIKVPRKSVARDGNTSPGLPTLSALTIRPCWWPVCGDEKPDITRGECKINHEKNKDNQWFMIEIQNIIT